MVWKGLRSCAGSAAVRREKEKRGEFLESEDQNEVPLWYRRRKAGKTREQEREQEKARESVLVLAYVWRG